MSVIKTRSILFPPRKLDLVFLLSILFNIYTKKTFVIVLVESAALKESASNVDSTSVTNSSDARFGKHFSFPLYCIAGHTISGVCHVILHDLPFYGV